MIRMSRPAGGREVAAACQCRVREGTVLDAVRRAGALPAGRSFATACGPAAPPPGSGRSRRARRLRVIAAGAPAPARAATLGVTSGVPLSGSNAEAITATLVATRAPPTVIRREAGHPGVIGASGDALHAHFCGTVPSANAVSTMAYALPPGAMSRAPPRGRASHRRPCRVSHLEAWLSRVRVP